MSHWSSVDISATTGNAGVFICAKGVVVERSGNDADEIDFNNAICTNAAWILTSVDPIALSVVNRNDPA